MEKYNQEVIINDYSGGWNPKWSLNASQLLVNQSPFLANADYTGRFALTKRRGVVRVGNDTAGTGNVKSLWTYRTLAGVEYLIRSRGTVLEYLDTGTDTWTSFRTGLTADRKFDAVTANGVSYFGNAVDNFAYWDGTTLTTSGTPPKGNIYSLSFFRLWIAGVTANPNRLYYSVINSYADFSGGGAGSTDFPAKITACASFFTRDGLESQQVFLDNGDVYDVGFDSGGIYKKKIRSNVGSVNQRVIKQTEDYNFTVDIFSNVRALGYEDARADLRSRSRSLFIEDYLKTLTLTDACAEYANKNYVLAVNEDATVNNKILLYSEDYDSWRLYEGIGANQFAIYGNKLHFASSTDLNVYRFESTEYSDDGVPIYFEYQTRDLDFNRPIQYKSGRYVKVSGLISTLAEIRVKCCIDEDLSSPIWTKTIRGDGAYVSSSIVYPWGTAEWGSVPFAAFGGSDSTIQIKPFWVAMSIPSDTPFEKIRFVIENDQMDVDFVLTEIKVLAMEMQDDRIPVDHQL